LGVAPATVYYVASGQYDKKIALQSNLTLSFWIGILSVLLGVIIVLLFSKTFFADVEVYLLFFVLFSIPAQMAVSYLQGVSQGLQDFKTYNMFSIFPQIVMLVMAYVTIWVLKMDVFGAVLTYVSSVYFSAVTLIIFIFHRLSGEGKIKFSLRPNRKYSIDILKYGVKSHLANIVGFLNYRADTFLLNFFSGVTAVGVYGVSVGIAERMWILSASVSTVLYPKIASMENSDDKRNLLTPLIARHVLLFSFLLSVVVGLLSDYIIGLLYGYEYLESARALRWLMPGVVMTSMSRVLANDIAGRGYPMINLRHSLVALGVNILANIILIPILGVVGVAISSTISYSLVAIIKVISYSRLANVRWQDLLLLTYDDIHGWKTMIQKILRRVN
jgi:O-antigen/teichoic acid export membrane protein